MKYMKLKKMTELHSKYFTPFWRNAEKFYIEKIPAQKKKISKCKKIVSFLKYNK